MEIYEYREAMVGIFQEYIASEEWLLVKHKVIERDDYSCVDCQNKLPGGKGGIVHHEHYDDWGKGDLAEIESCVFLCRKCHNTRHAQQEMKLKTPFWAKQSPDIFKVDYEALKKAMQSLRQ
jgi:5-methylcytosine-specific restriction endonuclease McrA